MSDRPSSELGVPSLTPPNCGSGRAALADCVDQFVRNLLVNEEAVDPRLLVGLSTARPLTAHVPRRRADADERVHQCRVAVRRLRTWLRAFSYLAPPDANMFARELAWYGDALGSPRDLAVLESTLGLDPQHPLHLELARRLEATRRSAEVDLRAARDSGRHEHLVTRAAGLGAEIRLGEPAGDAALRRGAAATWSDAVGAARIARADDASAPRHRLRIRLKRLQYVGEVLAVVEPETASLVRAAERLQTSLGVSHDHAVAADWLQSLMPVLLSSRSALAELVVRQRERETEAAAGWTRSFGRLAARAHRLGLED